MQHPGQEAARCKFPRLDFAWFFVNILQKIFYDEFICCTAEVLDKREEISARYNCDPGRCAVRTRNFDIGDEDQRSSDDTAALAVEQS